VIDPSEKARGRRRLLIFAGLLAAIGLALVVKLFHLMVLVPAREGEQALVLPEVDRGAILDRQGRLLAVTSRQKTVSAWVPGITAPEETADILARTLGLSAADIRENWRRHPGYAIVKRRIGAPEAAALQALRDAGKLAGVKLEDEPGRFYPEGRLASHVIGYVGSDNVPWDGIEYTFNNELAPQPVGTVRGTVFGNQVVLTLDVNVEYLVEKTARAALASTRADSITILVMEARSGEILAYSALPDFDPNEFQKESPQVDRASLPNRPIASAYEPGSVFKIFSMASLLDLGAVTPESRFTCPGYYEQRLRDGSVIRINCIREHGEVTPQLILKYSCNAGAGYASDRADSDSFAAMLTRFGFGKTTGLPLLGETAGLLRKPSQWSARSKATIAMGQEVSASALQVITAATAIANGGVLLKPLIVRRIVSPEGKVVKEFGREPLWEAVSPATARQVLSMMETATEEGGTARRAAVPGIRISAKTGTAQVASRDTGTYSEKDFIASMLGIFPTDDPRYIVYVVIQNPRGESYYGSTIAAPVFRDIAVSLADYAGIPREGSQVVSHPGEMKVKLPRKVDVSGVMPDLRGTPKRLLLPLLLRDDLSVRIRGSGSVVRQDPPPGTALSRGSVITLELE
jgi:cell division protein FtsI (penicillin-binding protein 3)